MNRCLVVCGDCRAVSAAEVLPVWEELLDAESWWLMSRIRRALIRRLIGDTRNLPPASALALEEPEAFGLLYRISELDRKPVCLRCGSPDFQTIRYPSDYIDNGKIFRLGLTHPGCGGDLLVHGSNGARLGIDPDGEPRRYDWQTGRQVSGPALLDESMYVSAYAPPERRAMWDSQ